MKWVLDRCMALKWVLPEHDTPKAVRVRNDYSVGQHCDAHHEVVPRFVKKCFIRRCSKL